MFNVYSIPTNGMTNQEYFDHVSGMEITFTDLREIFVDVTAGEVKVDGTISGLTPVRTEEPTPPEGE